MEPNQQPQWYHADGQQPGPASEAPPSPEQQPANDQPIVWVAAEHSEHSRGGGWYFMLLVIVIAVSGLFYLITRSIFSALTALVIGVIVAVYAGRGTQAVSYEVNFEGISVGRRRYTYHDFKSFSLFQDGYNIIATLQPLRRALPPLTMYLDPQQATAIAALLSNNLPVETYQPDFVDRLVKRLRF